MIKRENKYGYFDVLKIKTKISAKFDFAYNFTDEGVACVKIGDKYGYIKRNGSWWQEPIYDFAQSFRNRIAVVELNNQEFFIKFG